MSAHKKLFIFFTLAVIALVASATTTEAQGRRRGRGSRVVVVGGYYANPFFYDPFFADPWYGYQYPWHPYGYGYGPEASVRLEVSPKEAEVYIDGYYAGVVDDFDGIFQRMHLESGPHRIEVRAPGYETLAFDVRITPEHTTTYQGELKRIQ